jgi:hypothetical protein
MRRAGMQVVHGVSQEDERTTRGNRDARARRLPRPGCHCIRGEDAMTASRTASAAGIATLMLLAGCDQPSASAAAAATPPPSAVVRGTVVADTAALERGAHGAGIRPTGTTPNGITP